jgi:beta-lactam-binding protein with PASTA domain
VVRQEYEPERRRRRTGWILLTLIVLAIVGVAVWAILGLTGGPKFTNVPNVAGMSTSAAISKLNAAGLNPVLDDPVPNATVPAGQVIGTDPAAGTRIQKGKTVHISWSRGPAVVQVPDVTGKTQAQAKAALEKVGLKVGRVTQQNSDTVRAGLVISQTPNGGLLQAGQSVDLVISKGKPLVTVPDVTGQSQSAAEDALRQADLKPQVVQDPTCFDPSGGVCRQDPAGGQQVASGSTVTIFVPVSESPSPTPSDTSTSPFPTPSGS